MIYFADGKVDVDAVKKKFRRFMVKDSVKSVKGTEFPAFLVRTSHRRSLMTGCRFSTNIGEI